MAEIKYTPAQRTAVYWGGGNLLLSAAAGSGKTAALTGRIVELVKEGADLSEMLVVTFTKAAAGEMRGRISKALSKAADDCENPAIYRAISKVPSAEISTIHSFLYRALRPYFPVLGLPQDSHIADTKIIDRLREEAMKDVVDRRFGEDGDALERFILLSDIIGQVRDTSSIDGELLWIADRLTSAGKDERALGEYADALLASAKGGIMSSSLGEIIKTALCEFFAHYLKVFLVLLDEFGSLPKVNEKYGADLNKIIEWLDGGYSAVRSGACLDELRFHFDTLLFERLTPLSKNHACDSSEAFKLFRNELKVAVTAIKEKFLCHTEEEATEQSIRTAEILRLTAEVIGEFFEEFSKKKREASLLDYGDIENMALKLLIDSEGNPTHAAREIGERYKYVFIDEYQDTNLVQDQIFCAISKNARRFMVGDIKQAIYRFRGANPQVFSDYRLAWEVIEPMENPEEVPFSEETSPDTGSSLFMSENFRCDAPVVNIVNKVSDYILPFGGIPYEERDALIYAKNGGVPTPTSPAAEICLIDTKVEKNEGEDNESAAVEDPEAEYVAERIASMIGKYTPDGERTIKAGDIAILLRSPKTNGGAYRAALEKRGISSAIKVEKPLSSYPSVMLLYCILNFIDNPIRDIYVTGALRSPVFSFSMSELVAIREEDSTSPLYLGIVNKGKDADSPLAEKCADCVLWLEKQKTVSRGMRVDKYLEYLIDEISLFSINGIRENGGERDAVNRFCSLAADFEKSCGGAGVRADLSSFLEYAKEALDSDEGNKGNGGGDECVSIMSIHASKGLEFPVCFVSHCGKVRNAKDESRTILYHNKLGFAMYLPDDSRLMKCDTLLRRILAEKIRRDSVNEEMRLLYVALTRAREHLIITGKVSDADKKLTAASLQREFSDAYHVTNTSHYIDWIIEATSGVADERIKLSVIPADSITAKENTDGEAEASVPADEVVLDYRSRFDFEYPEKYLSRVPAKLTVSRLDPQILDEDEISIDAHSRVAKTPEENSGERPMKRPVFMSEDEAGLVTAAEKGTATHVFMQFVDFAALREGGVRAEIDRMVRDGFISPGTADMINVKQMERFAGSALLDKMLRSPMVKREFRFNARLDAARFTADSVLSEKLSENGVKITVQGVVDCVFRDPDTGVLTLIDYKTDSLTEEEWKDQRLAEEKLRSRHREQLSYYREICSDMFGEEIPSAYVYSTVLGRLV